MTAIGKVGTLTDRQEGIVEALLQGKSIPEAGRIAGYAHASGAYQAVSSNAVQNALLERRRRILRLEGAGLAVKTMIELMGEDKPASVRFQAARWVAGLAGLDAQEDAIADKPIAEMTEDELERFVAKVEERAARTGASPTVRLADSQRDDVGNANGTADAVPALSLETGRGRGTQREES